MKCLYCDKEMVYKPNMRGYYEGSFGKNTNTLVIDCEKEIERDYIIVKKKKKLTVLLK